MLTTASTTTLLPSMLPVSSHFVEPILTDTARTQYWQYHEPCPLHATQWTPSPMWTSSLESNHNSLQSPCAPDLFRPLLLCRCPRLLPQSQAQRSCKSPVACLCLVGQGRTQKKWKPLRCPGSWVWSSGLV